MSLASERLVIPITAKDKARVERKAAMAGRLSTAEAAAAELRGLVAGFEELHANTLAQLDRTDAALDAALAHFNRDRV